MTRAIVLDRRDNVATLIDAGRAGAACRLQGEADQEIRLTQDIPFGHKVCIRELSPGAEVTKYGQVIGKASAAIKVGEHVHAHNVESARGRGDQVKKK
ncbi:MAG: UxaA family hydrolase [Burkholderiaceae bacterium]